MIRVPFGLQNPFLDIGYSTVPAVANAALADLRCDFARLGSGGAYGGAARWNQMDTVGSLQQTVDNLDRLVAQGVPLAIVNVSGYRQSDLAVPLTTLTAPIDDTTLLLPVANSLVLPQGYLIQMQNEQVAVSGYPDALHVTVAARGAHYTAPASHAAGVTLTRQQTTPQYPVDIAGYLAWLQASVAPLAHRSDIEVVFQLENEPMNDTFWVDSAEQYAHLVAQATPILHAEGRDGQRVLLAGMSTSYLFTVLGALEAGTGRPASDFFDIVDLHLFGLADQTDASGGLRAYDVILDQLAAYIASGAVVRPVWVTETVTYSSLGDQPVYLDPANPASTLPYPAQTEEQQAREAIKRMLYPLVRGVERVEWAYLPNTTPPAPPANTYFNYAGLLNGAPFTRKLAYWTLQQAADWLSRLDPSTLALTTPLLGSAWIKALSAADQTGRLAYCVWWDFYTEPVQPAPATTPIKLALSAGVSEVTVRPLVANRANGTLVTLADFDPVTLATPGAVLSYDLGHNPVVIEAASAPAGGGPVGPSPRYAGSTPATLGAIPVHPVHAVRPVHPVRAPRRPR